MNPKDALNKAVARCGEILAAAKQAQGQVRIVETYGRFALQWLERVRFDCELPKDLPKIVELGNSHRLFQLQALTAMMACVSNKEDPAKVPLLRWSAEQARERKLFDSFEGDTVRVPFDMLAGFFCESFLKILKFPGIRDYDVRILTQMSIPKLWKAAKASDFICEDSGQERLRLMNLAEVATDMDGICATNPDVAFRELIAYVEGHMTKTKLGKDINDKIREMLTMSISAQKKEKHGG